MTPVAAVDQTPDGDARQSPVARFRVTQDQRRVLYAIAAAIVLFAVGGLIRPGFASMESVEAVLTVACFVGIVAAGQTFVILIGGIDLSVPWTLNAGAILMMASAASSNGRMPLALALTLGMGAVVGLCNGVGIAIFGVPAVVMTLAVNGMLEGLTLGLSGGLTCPTCAAYAPSLLQAVAHGTIVGIPAILWLWIAIILIASFVLSFTTFGRGAYAIGNNARASLLAGVHVTRTTIVLYALSGAFSSLAGIMLLGFGGQASLGIGDPYLFQSIAAAVIGGVYIAGGRGHYIGAAAGAVSLVALVSVLMALNMPEYGRSITYGVIILLLLLLYGRESSEG
jgi:ribose transport system permease protein